MIDDWYVGDALWGNEDEIMVENENNSSVDVIKVIWRQNSERWNRERQRRKKGIGIGGRE